MRRILRRAAVPVALVIAAGVFAVKARDADADSIPPAAIDRPAAVTPVLSARRLPLLLARNRAVADLQVRLAEFLAGYATGTCVAVTDAGDDLYGAHVAEPRTPASTEKLVTATAALAELGPEATFRTVVSARSAPRDGVVAGDLHLVGGGDPVLVSDSYENNLDGPEEPRTDLESLIDAVVAAGVTRITGAVVGDESRYDSVRAVPSWPERYLVQGQAGSLSALSVNDGLFDDSGILRRSPDPAATAAQLVSDALKARGVAIGDPPRSGPVPSGAVEVAAIESPPLQVIVRQLLTYSDNTTAELLLKELGHRRRNDGSTVAGTEAVDEILSELDLDRPGRTTVDGSGLDPGNRVSCDLLVDVLDAAGSDSPLAQGLAVAATSGTLRERFVGSPAAGRVRAKTGTLRDVTALAGFVDTDGGVPLTFAVVTNMPGGQPLTQTILDGQIRLAEILLGWPTTPPIAALGPR